jgi:hypothetical protein
MPRSELSTLLPPSVVSNRSRDDVLQQLAATPAGSGSGGPSAGGSSGSSIGSLSDLQGPITDMNSQLSALTAQITSLASAQQTQVSATQDNTQALTQNTSTKGGSGSSAGSVMGGVASSVLGGGLSPILSGLMSLFGGGGGQPSTVLPAFQLPSPVDYQAGLTGSPGQAVPVDSGQTGQPRTQSANSAPQVNIQVNAMDSQSFLDHSDEIASAVKAAILNSHSLTDVISDL